MRLSRLYIDDDGKLQTTAKQKQRPEPRNKQGLARAVELHANLVHKPPQSMGARPIQDIKIPNV